MDFHAIVQRFRDTAPAGATACSLRLVDERSEEVMVRQGVLQPLRESRDMGAMITVYADGGAGYASTSDVSAAGLKAASHRALAWAKATAARSIFDSRRVLMPQSRGHYRSAARTPSLDAPVPERIALVSDWAGGLRIDPRIIDWHALLWSVQSHTLYATLDGGEVEQMLYLLTPDLSVTAHDHGETIVRSTASRGRCLQGGLEALAALNYPRLGGRLAEEALALTAAPDCPVGPLDLLLMPDQMMLQIHESIGHPLELDRILGDERNYAGTSFVTLDMFGHYQYGSPLLNVTFDPNVAGEFASYRFDDDGTPAERTYLIRNGLLERPLGSALSSVRAELPGVANARATSWNRPPIDRMANLNIEPGESTFQELVSRVERGVLMETNCSWSIDDSRNKFQFGCELGRLIEGGEIKGLVKKPNYRGVSASFWRNLAGVGDRSTVEVLGSPFCGKGEPNQVIRVGHASPVCLFTQVEVFGGD